MSARVELTKEYRVPSIIDQEFEPSVDRRTNMIEFTADPLSLSKVLSAFHGGVRLLAIKSHMDGIYSEGGSTLNTPLGNNQIELRTYVFQEGMHHTLFESSMHTCMHVCLLCPFSIILANHLERQLLCYHNIAEITKDSLHTSLSFNSNIAFRSYKNTLGTTCFVV